MWATLGEAARRAREMGDKKDETMLEVDEGTLKALGKHSGALSPAVIHCYLKLAEVLLLL